MALHKDCNWIRDKLLPMILAGLVASPAAQAESALDEIEKLIRLRDYHQAVKQLQPLVRQGDREGLYRLAGLYRTGKGVGRDLEKATGLYQRAAAAGHADAQFALALLIEKTNDSPSARRESLHWYRSAAALGHARAMEKLGQFDDMPEMTGRETRRDDIFNAIRHNDEILINSLVAGGANLDLTDRQGNSTVLAALRAGWPRLAATLIDNTRLHSQPNASGTSPLHVAASKGYRDIVVALLARRVDINAADSRGDTALMLATRSKKNDIVVLLLERGARYDLVNQKNKSAVDMAYAGENAVAKAIFEQRGVRPVPVADKPVTSDLPAFRLSVEQHGSRYAGWPLLNIAIELGDNSIAQQLITAGPDLSETDPDGNTALHVAARKGDLENLRQLIGSGAEVNALNKRNETALYLATEADSLRSVHLLLKNRADPSLETQLGTTPLEAAVNGNRTRIARMILSVKTSYAGIHRVLLRAIQNDMQELSHALIKRDGDLGALDENGRSALWYSADRGLETTSKILIASRKIDLNKLDVNGHGALTQAIINGHTKIALMLIKWGADLQIRTSEGNTLLMLAVLAQSPEIVNLLLRHRVEVNAQDRVGDTALMLAASTAQISMIEMLINAGADLQLRNGEELNAYQIAQNAGHQEVAEFIHDKSNLVFKLFN